MTDSKAEANGHAFAEKLRQSMRASATSVSLITTRDEAGAFHGMAVTSASSLSMEPPSMMVAINRNASSYPVLLRSGVFCLNIIHNGHIDTLEAFYQSDKRDQRFASSEWRSGAKGLPYLQTAIASLFCTIEQAHDYGTHTVFFGRIDDIHVSDEIRNAEPLIWINGGPARFRNEPRAAEGAAA